MTVKSRQWTAKQSYQDAHCFFIMRQTDSGLRRVDRMGGFEIDDAALIAAAPLMLEALEKAEAFISGFEDDPAQEDMSALDAVRSARAAAKGGAA